MISYSVLYNRKNKLRLDGTALVQICAYDKISRKRKVFGTGIFVKPIHWSPKLKIVIGHKHTVRLNRRLRDMLSGVEEYTHKMVQRHKFVTLDQITSYMEMANIYSFTEFWKVEMERDAIISHETRKSQKTAYNHWVRFRKDVLFHELTYDLILEFEKYMLQRDLHTNTRYTNHKQVRRYINLAIKKDLFDINRNPYKKFVPKQEDTERIYLTLGEVDRIEKMKVPNHLRHLDTIRDLFLVSCYTGLRFSDVAGLTRSNMYKIRKGYNLRLQAQKTKKYLTLPLYLLHGGKPEQILLKYYNNTQLGQAFFKGFSNQYVNRELKKMANIANIPKRITTHVARHTFATSLAAKIPSLVLQELLQHSKLTTTMIYVHLSARTVNNVLEKVDWDEF